MPFFDQGSDPLDHQDSLNYFRSGPSPADMARYHQEWQIQQQRDANAAMIGWSVLAVIVIAAAYCAFLYRRKIAGVADAAVISGLATGVRTARAARSRKAALMARVIAKADEKTSPQD
jgi:hypothetical protein